MRAGQHRGVHQLVEQRPSQHGDQADQNREDQCAVILAADRGGEHADAQEEEKEIGRNERDAPDFAVAHAAHQQGNGQHGQDGQNAIGGMERSRGEFSEDDIVAAQIGEEEQAHRSFPFFRAQATTGQLGANNGDANEQQHGQRREQFGPNFARIGPAFH